MTRDGLGSSVVESTTGTVSEQIKKKSLFTNVFIPNEHSGICNLCRFD